MLGAELWISVHTRMKEMDLERLQLLNVCVSGHLRMNTENPIITGYFKGSIFVTRAAATHLEGRASNYYFHILLMNFIEYLRDSSFLDDVPHMIDKFDKATKLAFRAQNDPQYIKFGSVRDKDPIRGIRAGKLRLEG